MNNEQNYNANGVQYTNYGMNMMPIINNNMNFNPNMNMNNMNMNIINMNQMYNDNNININQMNNNNINMNPMNNNNINMNQMNNIINLDQQMQMMQNQLQMINLNNEIEEQNKIKKNINNYYISKKYEIDFKRIEAQNKNFKEAKKKLLNHVTFWMKKLNIIIKL